MQGVALAQNQRPDYTDPMTRPSYTPLTDPKLLERLISINNPHDPQKAVAQKHLDLILQALKETPPSPQLEKAIQDYWLDIADHFGLWRLRYRIEDQLFQLKDPKTYHLIQSLIEKKTEIHQDLFREITQILKDQLKKIKLSKFKIQFRKKNAYGIFRKMSQKKKSINHLDDFFAFRIIVPTETECYAALNRLHQLWAPYPDRFKDYIKTPKPNGYQSLHTTLHCLQEYAIEFQIRSEQMDKIAKYGPAAHGKYRRTQEKIRTSAS